MNLVQDSMRGEQAHRLLRDPLLLEAFDTLAASLRDAWLATGEAECTERERLWLMLKLLARLKGHLTQVLETGKLAELERAASDEGRR